MINKFPTPDQEKKSTLDELKTQLREHIKKTVIKTDELIQKALQAEANAWKRVREGEQQNLEGEEFRGDHIMNPKDKAHLALLDLSDDVQKEVLGHGVASNRPTQERGFPVRALVNILATGVLKGDFAPLSGGLN